MIETTDYALYIDNAYGNFKLAKFLCTSRKINYSPLNQNKGRTHRRQEFFNADDLSASYREVLSPISFEEFHLNIGLVQMKR